MQAPSDNEAYLTVPLPPWETIKRPLDSQDAPDTVSSSPKRSCTPENTFSSKYFPVSASNEDISSAGPAVGTTLPLLGPSLESELTYDAFPGTDAPILNFIHQPGHIQISSSNQATHWPHSFQLTTPHDGTWNQVHNPFWESFGYECDRPDIGYSPSQVFETTETFMDNEYLVQDHPFPYMGDIISNQQSDPPEDSSGHVFSLEPNTDVTRCSGPMETEMETTKREGYEGHPSPMTSPLDDTAPQKTLEIFVPPTDVLRTVGHDAQLGVEVSKPFKSCNFEGQAVSKPADDEDRSLAKLDTCLGLVRRSNRYHYQPIQY